MRTWSISGLCAALFLLIVSGVSGGQIQLSRPKGEKPMPNPAMIAVSREEMRAVAKQMLESREIAIDKDECNQQNGECTIISKPVVFVKGIPTRSQLEHYCDVPGASYRNWSRGRYVLRIQINPASPKSSQVGVYAKFDGMADGMTGSEWITLTSKGELEDGIIRCLDARARGIECREDIR